VKKRTYSEYKFEVNPFKKNTYRVVILPTGLVARECESFYGSSLKWPCYHYTARGTDVDPKKFITNKFGRIENITICSDYIDAEKKGGRFLKEGESPYSGL